MKSLISFTLFLFGSAVFTQALAQETMRLSKLEIGRKQKEVFSNRDSSLILRIDTLIMKNRARLVFYGKKDVKISVGHAVIGKRAYIFGTDGKNNGTDFDIAVRFAQLGELYVLAGGLDAHNNGSRTHPNGDGGDVTLAYAADGVVPQTDDKKSAHYLRIDTRAGGHRVNPQTDLGNIYSLINMGSGSRPLGNLSQGMVYSGSPGEDGEVTISAL